jgi:Family of unknown function (DUF5681)
MSNPMTDPQDADAPDSRDLSDAVAPEGDCAVGYRRPPVGTRFKPGVSGNPCGRPKAPKSAGKSLKDAMARYMRLKVGLPEPNGRPAQPATRSRHFLNFRDWAMAKKNAAPRMRAAYKIRLMEGLASIGGATFPRLVKRILGPDSKRNRNISRTCEQAKNSYH